MKTVKNTIACLLSIALLSACETAEIKPLSNPNSDVSTQYLPQLDEGSVEKKFVLQTTDTTDNVPTTPTPAGTASASNSAKPFPKIIHAEVEIITNVD